MGSPVVAFGAGLLILSSSSLGPANVTPHSAPQTAVPPERVFASDAGLVLNFIKPDKTADFEAVIAKLRRALQHTDNPDRVRQARGWKVFRAAEPAADGAVLYVFVIDPAVKGMDYTVSSILAGAFPEEVQPLYKQFAESYSTGQNIVNLTLVAALGEATPITK